MSIQKNQAEQAFEKITLLRNKVVELVWESCAVSMDCIIVMKRNIESVLYVFSTEVAATRRLMCVGTSWF